MEKKESPAEGTDPGQLTEEQTKKIMEPIGAAPEPASPDKFSEEPDEFLDDASRQRALEYVAGVIGPAWEKLDVVDQNRMAKKYTDAIVQEVITMAGGIWKGLPDETKREIFNGRFFDKTVAPAERKAAFEGLSGEPKEDTFPGRDDWMLQNRDMLYGMTLTEKEEVYRKAAAKAHAKK